MTTPKRKLVLVALVLAALSAVLAGFVLNDNGAHPVATAQARDRVVPPSREAVQYSFAPIVRKAAPAVVNVYVQSRVRGSRLPFANDPLFRRFFGDDFAERLGGGRERLQNSLGSGVLVSEDGVIVTNTHVIKARGQTKIRVALSDKREFDATVLTQDKKTDIAVLKIDGNGEDFPYLDFEDSDSLEVGDLVLAIGNPFGVGQTVTSGIVSALARSQIKSEAVFIQTDAAINPGNSGGALVDVSGNLVGINTAIFSKSGGSHGIGFAIPSNLVRLFVDSAVAGRKVERPWLGARLKPVTREVADTLGLSRVAGALVDRVYDKGPAAGAGLKPGDVIVRVDGFEVSDERAVNYRLTTRGVGQVARLTVIRDGQRSEIDIGLRAAPEPGRDDVRNLSGDHPLDGARVANILPTIAEELLINETRGVVILSVQPGSISSKYFRRGEVITKINDTNIETLRDLNQILRDRRSESWVFHRQYRGKRLRPLPLQRLRR